MTVMEIKTSRGVIFVSNFGKARLTWSEDFFNYDINNKRIKQIDLDRPHRGVSPHTHHGYKHSENDSPKRFSNLTTEEKKMVDRVKEKWHYKNK